MLLLRCSCRCHPESWIATAYLDSPFHSLISQLKNFYVYKSNRLSMAFHSCLCIIAKKSFLAFLHMNNVSTVALCLSIREGLFASGPPSFEPGFALLPPQSPRSMIFIFGQCTFDIHLVTKQCQNR